LGHEPIYGPTTTPAESWSRKAIAPILLSEATHSTPSSFDLCSIPQQKEPPSAKSYSQRHDIDEKGAFEMFRERSRVDNGRLIDLAAAVVDGTACSPSSPKPSPTRRLSESPETSVGLGRAALRNATEGQSGGNGKIRLITAHLSLAHAVTSMDDNVVI
jgi:hypothetical protein